MTRRTSSSSHCLVACLIVAFVIFNNTRLLSLEGKNSHFFLSCEQQQQGGSDQPTVASYSSSLWSSWMNPIVGTNSTLHQEQDDDDDNDDDDHTTYHDDGDGKPPTHDYERQELLRFFQQAKALRTEMSPHGPQQSRTLVNWKQPTLLVPSSQDNIALAIHLAADCGKLETLLLSIDRWSSVPSSSSDSSQLEEGASSPSPPPLVSISIWIHNVQGVHDLMDFMQEHATASQFQHAYMHLLLDEPDPVLDRAYPINTMRNIAADHCPTNYFVLLDVDFILNPHAHYIVQQLLPTIQPHLHNKTVFVVPSFEVFVSFASKRTRFQKAPANLLPHSKQELVTMANASSPETFHVLPFHLDRHPNGHGRTNHDYWYQQQNLQPSSSLPNDGQQQQEAFYPTTWELGYEPDILAYKAPGLPPWWSGFRVPDFNKETWFRELHCLGYSIMVLQDVFSCHLNHPYGAKNATIGNQQIRKFTNYLKEQYPEATKREPDLLKNRN